MKWTLIAALCVLGSVGIGAGRALANEGEGKSWVEPKSAGGAFLVGSSSLATATSGASPSSAKPPALATPASRPTAAPQEPEPTPTPETKRAPELTPKNPVASETATAPILALPNISPTATKSVPAESTKTNPTAPSTKLETEPLPTRLAPVEPCPKGISASINDDARCGTAIGRK